MIIKNDLRLLSNLRAIQDATSLSVKITSNQVCEIVVADLMAKYKSCLERNDNFQEHFANVLRFYLDDDEFNEMLENFEI